MLEAPAKPQAAGVRSMLTLLFAVRNPSHRNSNLGSTLFWGMAHPVALGGMTQALLDGSLQERQLRVSARQEIGPVLSAFAILARAGRSADFLQNASVILD